MCDSGAVPVLQRDDLEWVCLCSRPTSSLWTRVLESAHWVLVFDVNEFPDGSAVLAAVRVMRRTTSASSAQGGGRGSRPQSRNTKESKKKGKNSRPGTASTTVQEDLDEQALVVLVSQIPLRR